MTRETVVPADPSWEPEDDEGPQLGSCCCCERDDKTVRNIIMLPKRSSLPGRGWGCFQCDLPSDGAVAVVCDDCLENGGARAPKFACRGYPGIDGRVPIEALTGEFHHDMTKHPGER